MADLLGKAQKLIERALALTKGLGPAASTTPAQRAAAEEKAAPAPAPAAPKAGVLRSAGGTTNWPAEALGYPPQFWVGVAQSVGLQREHNEDALYAAHTVLAVGALEHRSVGLFVVADGMGGHLHGEIASQAAIEAFTRHVWNHLLAHLHWSVHSTPPTEIYPVLHYAVAHAQDEVLEKAPGGGTTLTAVLALDKRLFVTHIGDSRAYLYNPLTQELRLLTQDHTWVHRLEELGELSAEEAARHPHRNVLYKSLGQGSDSSAEADISLERWAPGMMLLLCSDGLWDVVPDEAIQEVLAWASTPSAAAQRLVQMANDAGGPDNISVVVVAYRPTKRGQR